MNTGMDVINEIHRAMRQAHESDIPTIKQYIAWVVFRRRMHDRFYFRAHWVQKSAQRAHWVWAREGN